MLCTLKRDVDEPVRRVNVSDVLRELEVRHLNRFHEFTEKLEHMAVNPVAIQIAHKGYLGLTVDRSMRREAFALYTDEGFHTQNSADLIAQVTVRS